MHILDRSSQGTHSNSVTWDHCRVGKGRVILADTFPQSPLRTGLDTFASSSSPELNWVCWITVSQHELHHDTMHKQPASFFAEQSY